MTQRLLSFAVLLSALCVAVYSLVPGVAAEDVSGRLPTGTIVAWVPQEGSAGPPPGWWVCDQETHAEKPWVPDLSGRFLIGASAAFDSSVEGVRASDVGQRGGSPSHGHRGSRTPLEYATPQRVERGGIGAAEAARASHKHSVQVSPESHLPPFHRVVYIIKG